MKVEKLKILCFEKKTQDGKKFKVYETTDKNNNRLSVRFIMDVKAPEKPCTINVIDGWIDRRKQYPVLRVREYEIVTDDSKKFEERDKADFDEFFGK